VENALPLELADDPFHRAAAWVARACGPNVGLRHPAELIGRAPPTCPNRYAVYGFPGSGNILTQSLVVEMFARRPAPPPPSWVMRATLTEHFFYSFAARVKAAVAPMSPTHVDFVPHEFGTMLVTVQCGDRAGVAFYVPSHRHLGLPVFHTHSRPTRQSLDFFESVGARGVAVVRHPLETILSQANKIARPSRVMLDDARFVDRAAAQLTDWTAHLLANRGRLHVVRYEDLAERRIDELQRMGAFLGMTVTEQEAGELFDACLNRNLSSRVPTHFHRGGSDKWRGEMTAADVARVRRSVPDEVFTAFGYPLPTAADLNPVPFTGTPARRNGFQACLAEAYPFRPVPGRHGIQVTGTDEGMVAGLMTAFRDPEVLALLDAGGLTADTRPKAPFELAAA
jgi:hypothetical protein